MLHICPRLPHQPIVEPPFKEEILAFLHFLGHSAAIRKLTDLTVFSSLNAVGVIPQEECLLCLSDVGRLCLPGLRLTTSEKGKQAAKASKAKSLSALSKMKELVLYQGFPMYPLMSLRKISLGTQLMKKVMMMKERMVMVMMMMMVMMVDDEQAFDEEEFIHPSLSTHAEEEPRDEDSFNPSPKTPEDTNDEGNDEEKLGIHVKEQVTVQVSKILPEMEQTVNEKLEAKVLTRSSNLSKTSYDVAGDLSEMELKKILIKKMEGNKSIHRPNEHMNVYKALVGAYESDKIILDTYEYTVTLKRRHDDNADKDEEPSARSDRGSKRRREGKESESASAPMEKATRSAGKSIQGSKSRQTSTSESAIAEEPMQTTFEMEEPAHPEFETVADDQPIVESSQHPEWFSQQLKPPTLDHDWNKTLSATHGNFQP
nr:hypothetical protein [Tanacetum cinerariifolium]